MKLEFMYRFTALGTARVGAHARPKAGLKPGAKPLSGLIAAGNRYLAISRLKKLGLQGVWVQLDWVSSIETSFGLLSANDFDAREKVRLYESISRRLANGGRLGDALMAASHYLSDKRLIGAVSIAAAAQSGGLDGWKAMEAGGFSARDVTVVQALERAGALPRAFGDLAREAQLREQSDRAISSAMRQPIGMAIFLYCSILGVIGWIAPTTAKLFKQMGDQIKLTPMVASFYDFVALTQQSPMLWFLIWASLGVVGFLINRSNLPLKVLSQIPTFRELILKREHMQLWSMYALLASAGISLERICRDLSGVCVLAQTKRSLKSLELKLASGMSDAKAASEVQFPDWVVGEYVAAKEATNLAQGLERFVQRLGEDIIQLTERSSAILQKLSLLFGVLILFSMFSITVLPLSGTLLHSL
jgi:type II secretory pathway component PulF